MKEKLLQYLSCPDCRSSLELTSNKKEGEEILEGAIQCITCGTSYPIERGVPIFIPCNTISEKEKTISDDFGYEWNKWSNLANYQKNEEQFFD
jgi:uncharacterized protein YbaR (Trm112 family)